MPHVSSQPDPMSKLRISLDSVSLWAGRASVENKVALTLICHHGSQVQVNMDHKLEVKSPSLWNQVRLTSRMKMATGRKAHSCSSQYEPSDYPGWQKEKLKLSFSFKVYFLAGTKYLE